MHVVDLSSDRSCLGLFSAPPDDAIEELAHSKMAGLAPGSIEVLGTKPINAAHGNIPTPVSAGQGR
jgi:hypothetical protein